MVFENEDAAGRPVNSEADPIKGSLQPRGKKRPCLLHTGDLFRSICLYTLPFPLDLSMCLCLLQTPGIEPMTNLAFVLFQPGHV